MLREGVAERLTLGASGLVSWCPVGRPNEVAWIMKPIALVTGWNLLPFIAFLDGIGAPVGRWLADARIPARVMESPDRSVPLRLCLDFMERAASAEGADSIGLDVGRHATAESFGRAGSTLGRCPTLYSRINLSCRLLSAFNNCSAMWLESDGDDVQLHARFDCTREPALRHAEDMMLMLMLEAVGRAAAPGWKPGAIHLPGTRSQRFARDELFQGVTMVYGAPDVAVAFPAELLDHPLRKINGGPTAREWPMSSSDDRAPAADFIGSLEDTVMALLPCGCPSVRELAAIAQLSQRTLQRRVAQEGSNLRRIFDHARFRLAADYLRDGDATVTDIALELGYSDSTAFTRAFHRMAGVTPSRYRDRRLDA